MGHPAFGGAVGGGIEGGWDGGLGVESGSFGFRLGFVDAVKFLELVEEVAADAAVLGRTGELGGGGDGA
jgi:hypothetical protein